MTRKRTSALSATLRGLFAAPHAIPRVRHRELARNMLDEEACEVYSLTVYRLLREARLLCRLKPKLRRKGSGSQAPPTRPDQLWQTSNRHHKVKRRNYDLLTFIDAYSQYIVHHERSAPPVDPVGARRWRE